jgi:DNA-binding LytR/AlgR family response regulator
MENNKTPMQPKVAVGGWRQHYPADLMLLSAQVNYTELYFTNGQRLLVATPLKTLELRFAQAKELFRTHKSYMVNLRYIKRIDGMHSEDFIEMKNDFRVLIARRRKLAFEKRIAELNV